MPHERFVTGILLIIAKQAFLSIRSVFWLSSYIKLGPVGNNNKKVLLWSFYNNIVHELHIGGGSPPATQFKKPKNF